LLTENGERVIEFNRPAAYDELVLEVAPLWRRQRIRVRIATRIATQDDLIRLSARVDEGGDSDGVFIAAHGIADGVTTPRRLMLVTPEELVARLERSPLIMWQERRPTAAYERITALRGLRKDAALLDPVGIRWLPVLALNEVPVELSAQDSPPQDLLERVAFRLLTSVFRFSGERHGEAARGQRLADSVITSRAPGQPWAALVDCKASADGYVMTADHLLRFEEYVTRARPPLEQEGFDLRYLVVLSSDFPGHAGERHPYYGRARELEDRAAIHLVYLRAVHLARFATSIEGSEMPPNSREALSWTKALDRGLVSVDDLTGLMAG
jgi:hypothetical protein